LNELILQNPASLQPCPLTKGEKNRKHRTLLNRKIEWRINRFCFKEIKNNTYDVIIGYTAENAGQKVVK